MNPSSSADDSMPLSVGELIKLLDGQDEETQRLKPGAATDPPDRVRMMVTGWGVNRLFTPMNSQLQAVP